MITSIVRRTINLAAILTLLLATTSSQIDADDRSGPLRPLAEDRVVLEDGHSLALDGAGYVLVPNHSLLNPGGNLTIEAWIRRSPTVACETVVGKDFVTGWWLGICSDRIRFYTNGEASSMDGRASLPVGHWTHVAVTFDGMTRRYYVDGMLDLEADSQTDLSATEFDLGIGADHDGAWPFSGNIAEVRLWRTARTQDEIRRDMVRWVDTKHDELLAAWHLDGSAKEAFGRHSGSLIGGATFDGPAAPPVDHDPIMIPRAVRPPEVDGACESAGLRLPLWYTDVWQPVGIAWVTLSADDDTVYACMNQLPQGRPGGPGDFAALYLDPDASGGEFAQTTDYRILVPRVLGDPSSERGDGAGSYTSPGLEEADHEAARSADVEILWAAEYGVARRLFPGPNPVFGMQFIHHWLTGAGDDHGWPVNFDWNTPDTWERFQVDNEPTRPDSQNPTLNVIRTPYDLVRESDILTITASALDDVDLERIEIIVDGEHSESCAFEGDDNTQGTCRLERSFDLGGHVIFARALDHRGRQATFFARFVVTRDGERPTIEVTYSPREPRLNQSVQITARAADPSGIRSIRFTFGEHCEFTVPESVAECKVTFTPAANRRVERFRASATDREDLVGTTPYYTLLFGNDGADEDNDGLADDIEVYVGTSPVNPDTDHDTLLDGWEVVGKAFVDGDFIDLPQLGANPLRKDLFVQHDYERGVRLWPGVFTDVQRIFRENGITMHVTENERPRPVVGDVSTVESMAAAATLDDDGNYYFDPKLNWTHQNVYRKHASGIAGAWGPYANLNAYWGDKTCPFDAVDPQSDAACVTPNKTGGRRGWMAQRYELVHELGHTLGLGHGGTRAGNVPAFVGDRLWYSTSIWENSNRKPNYFSLMNYRGTYLERTSMCYDPADNSLAGALDFQSEEMPTLNEASLNEREDSEFAKALRARPCAAGRVPVFTYGCKTGSSRHLNMSDGRQIVGRVTDKASTWSYWNLPSHPPGIDWNCDGAIEPDPTKGVRANINGSGTGAALGEWLDGLIEVELTSGSDILAIKVGYECLDKYHSYDPGVLNNDRPVYRAMMLEECPVPPEEMVSTTVGHVGLDRSVRLAQPAPDDGPIEEEFDYDPLDVRWGRESCDGTDNDGDGLIDEDCPDVDEDGTVDNIDNCPETFNPDQSDLDGNLLGDACQWFLRSPADEVVFEVLASDESGTTVEMSWVGRTTDILGIVIRRWDPIDRTPVLVYGLKPGEGGQVDVDFIDEARGPGPFTYAVSPVDLQGTEGEPIEFTVGESLSHFASADRSGVPSTIFSQNLDTVNESKIEAQYFDQEGSPPVSVTRPGVAPLGHTLFESDKISGLPDREHAAIVHADRSIASVLVQSWPRGPEGAVAQLRPSLEVVVPLIVRNWVDQYSTVNVQNADENDWATVQVELYELGASSPVFADDYNVAPGGSLTLDLETDPVFGVLPTHFLGSMSLESYTGSPITAQATVSQSTSPLAIYAYEGLPPSAAASELFIPLFRRNWFGTTGINVQNTDTTVSTNVTVEFSGTVDPANTCSGLTIHQGPVAIPPLSAANFWQGDGGGSGLPDGCYGSAVIRAMGANVIAMVNDANLDGARILGSAAYVAQSRDDASTGVAVPYVTDDAGDYNWSTGIQVMNLGTVSTEVTLDVHNGDGRAIPCGRCTRTVGPGEAGNFVFVGDTPGHIMPGEIGTAILRSDQPIIVIVNTFAMPFGIRDSSTYNGIPLMQ